MVLHLLKLQPVPFSVYNTNVWTKFTNACFYNFFKEKILGSRQENE